MNLGKAIKRLRISAGLTQIDLSKRTGLSQTAISQIESNDHRPHETTLETIARAVKVPRGVIYLLAMEKADFPGRGQQYEANWPVIMVCIGNLTGKDPKIFLE